MALSCIFKHIPIISGATHSDTHYVNKGLLFRRSLILSALASIGAYALSIYKKIDIKIVAKYTIPAVAATIVLDCIISKIASRNQLKQQPVNPSGEPTQPLPSPVPSLPSTSSQSKSEITSFDALPGSSTDQPLPSQSSKPATHDLLFYTPENPKAWKLNLQNLTPAEIKKYVNDKQCLWSGIPENVRRNLLCTKDSIPLITEFFTRMSNFPDSICVFYFDMFNLGGRELPAIIHHLEEVSPLESKTVKQLIQKILYSKEEESLIVLLTLINEEGKLPFKNHPDFSVNTAIKFVNERIQDDEWKTRCVSLLQKSPEDLRDEILPENVRRELFPSSSDSK